MQRKEFVKFWARYLKKHPEKAWKEYVAFINSLMEIAAFIKPEAWARAKGIRLHYASLAAEKKFKSTDRRIK